MECEETAVFLAHPEIWADEVQLDLTSTDILYRRHAAAGEKGCRHEGEGRHNLERGTELLRWHRELSRQKWRRWRRQRSPGRPALADDIVGLI